MVKDFMFDKVRMNFGYGLVRLSPDMKIIDKNIKATETHVFPKRGASVIGLTDDRGKKLNELSGKAGDNTVVSFCDGIKRVEALAIREEGGEIMLLMHPLITSVTLGKNGRTSSAYGRNILSIIYGENIEKTYSIDEIFPFSHVSVKRLTLVTTAVSMIAEKLGRINFKNSITVNFDSMQQSLSLALDFTALTYALTEILSLENTFSDGKSSTVTFSCDGEAFNITLNARMKKNAVTESEIFGKLFVDALKLVGAQAEVKSGSDGFIFARVSLKTEMTTSYVREPGIFIEEAVYGYFDYAMHYYGFGEIEQ